MENAPQYASRIHVHAREQWERFPHLALCFPDFGAFSQAVAASRAPGWGSSGSARAALDADTHEAQALARSRMHLIRNPAGTSEQLPTIERKGARLTLWIYGPIGTGTLTAESLCDALSTHSDAAGVYLRIASAGGYAEQGLAVAEAIMRHPGRSIAIVDRFAYSGASAIASAANRVLIRRSATWMAHHCWQNVTGDADALNSYAGAMRSTDLRMSALYARRRRISPADCHRLLASGRYLTADEAVAAGVCDDVLGDLPYLMESFT